MCLLLFPDDLTVLLLFKGDYDVVINDYEKAKSLFGKTEVQVFKKCKIFFLLLLDLSFAVLRRVWGVYSTKSAACILDLVYVVLSLKCKTIGSK